MPTGPVARSVVLSLIVAGLFLVAGQGRTASGTPVALYPDLRTLPPSDLRFGSDSSLPGHSLLRFSNRAWNAGEGPLELRGDPTQASKDVYQRIYAADGTYT